MLQPLEIARPYETLMEVSSLLMEPLKLITREVIQDPLFKLAPGSSGYHHAYRGGLIQHTAEVMAYAGRLINGGDTWHAVTAAAIIHDYCKIHEYIILDDESIKKTEYHKTIGHVVGGYSFFAQRGKDTVPGYLYAEICHALLAHHGRAEWGSPVEPQTEVAFTLHSADMLSVQRAHRREKP